MARSGSGEPSHKIATELRAGAGRAPLNLPDFPETTDGTPLAARVLVLDDGQTRLAFVSLSVIALTRRQVEPIREAVAGVCGTDKVMVACTHVHSGPPVMSPDESARREMARRLAEAAKGAAEAALPLQPARVGYAADHLPGVSRVRRIIRRDGAVITLRRAWPQWWGWATDPETVGPEEPLDDLLTVVRVETTQGEPLGAVMHFTCHPIPDFFGYAARLVENALPGVPCLVFNGCQGSVDTPFEVPMRGKTQAEQLPQLGDVLGYRTLELLARAETEGETRLGFAQRELFLPVDEAFLAEPGERGRIWPEAVAERGFRTVTQVLRIGDLAFVAAPGEPQAGFAAEVAARSPFALTRVVGLANDECAYLLSAESRARGGYEADPATWGVVTGEGLPRLLETMTDCLREAT
ncbi:MAG: hypothetical protein ABFD96_10280 [Armatimonadia bacterium]